MRCKTSAERTQRFMSFRVRSQRALAASHTSRHKAPVSCSSSSNSRTTMAPMADSGCDERRHQIY